MEPANQTHHEKEYPAGLATFEDIDALVDQAAEKSKFGEIIDNGNGQTAVMIELDLIKGRDQFAGAMEALGNPSEAFVTILPSSLTPDKIDCVFELSYIGSTAQTQISDTVAIKYHSTYYDAASNTWGDSYEVLRTPRDQSGADVRSRSVAPMLFTAKHANALLDLLNDTAAVGCADTE